MQAKAKFCGNVHIIKLDHELLADSGDYIVISDNTAEAFTQAEVDKLFVVHGGHAARKVRRAHNLTIAERVLLAFGPDNGGHYLENLTLGKLGEILPDAHKPTLAARLSEAARKRWLLAKPLPHSREHIYSLTDQGVKVVRDLRATRAL